MNKKILAGLATLGLAASVRAANPDTVKSLAAYVNSHSETAVCDYNGRLVRCNLDVITVPENISGLSIPLDVRVATFDADGDKIFQVDRPLYEFGSTEVVRIEDKLGQRPGEIESATSILPDGRIVRQNLSNPKTFSSFQFVYDRTTYWLNLAVKSLRKEQREERMEGRNYERN